MDTHHTNNPPMCTAESGHVLPSPPLNEAVQPDVGVAPVSVGVAPVSVGVAPVSVDVAPVTGGQPPLYNEAPEIRPQPWTQFECDVRAAAIVDPHDVMKGDDDTLTNVTPHDDWHDDVTAAVRRHVILKLMQAIMPEGPQQLNLATQHKIDATYKDIATKAESNIYKSSRSREEYFTLLSDEVCRRQKRREEVRLSHAHEPIRNALIRARELQELHHMITVAEARHREARPCCLVAPGSGPFKAVMVFVLGLSVAALVTGSVYLVDCIGSPMAVPVVVMVMGGLGGVASLTGLTMTEYTGYDVNQNGWQRCILILVMVGVFACSIAGIFVSTYNDTNYCSSGLSDVTLGISCCVFGIFMMFKCYARLKSWTYFFDNV